jgi:hypothetical protein
MICTVQPARPDTLTRTKRSPSSASTGTTIDPTRAANPVSAITRGSPSASLPVTSPPVASLPVALVPAFEFAAKVADVIKRRVAVVSISRPAESCVLQVIKKSGSRAGPTLTIRSINRPL